MYARTIRRALSKNPHTKTLFQNIVAANRLPRKRSQRGIYVVNTHPGHLPGEHWTTVEYGPTHVYYFDPYGYPPHPRIMKYLRLTGAVQGKKLFYSPQRVQGYRATCGLHCIYHTLTRSTTRYAMNVFNTDLDFNDRLVRRLVMRLFDVKFL